VIWTAKSSIKDTAKPDETKRRMRRMIWDRKKAK